MSRTHRHVKKIPRSERDKLIQQAIENSTKQMKCSPNCAYFPCMECKTWTVDEDGVKHRADGKKFVCGYDGHLITSWYDECPKEKEKAEMMKEKSS